MLSIFHFPVVLPAKPPGSKKPGGSLFVDGSYPRFCRALRPVRTITLSGLLCQPMRDTYGHIWPCSARGLPCRTRCLVRGALLPHLFTLARRRFIFCGTFRPHGFDPGRPALSGGAFPCGVRKFLPRRGAGGGSLNRQILPIVKQRGLRRGPLFVFLGRRGRRLPYDWGDRNAVDRVVLRDRPRHTGRRQMDNGIKSHRLF